MSFLKDILIEVDITPRWFDLGPSLLDDIADVTRAIRDSENQLKPFIKDLQFGVGGFRLVLGVLPGQGTSGYEKARQDLVSLLDGLDAAVPRRARAAAENARKKAEAEAAEKKAQEVEPPGELTPPPVQAAPKAPRKRA